MQKVSTSNVHQLSKLLTLPSPSAKHTAATDTKKKPGNNENKQNIMQTHLHPEPSSNLLHGAIHSQQPANIPPIPNQTVNHPLTWSCELCGRMFATRDEWSLHAKSHLEVGVRTFVLSHCRQFDDFIFVAIFVCGGGHFSIDRRKSQ